MSPLKRKLTFLIVVAAVAASAAGAFAATQSSSSSPRQAFLNDVAHRLHVKPSQLKQALAGAFTDRLSALVAAGRLTKAQASAIEKHVKSSGRLPGLGWLRMGGGRVMRPGFGPGWYGYAPGPAVPGAKLPPGVEIPPGVKLPPGVELPPGVKLPPGAMLPPGLRRFQVKPGVPLPPAVLLPPVAMARPWARTVPFPVFGFGFLVPGGRKAAVSYLGLEPGQLMKELQAGKSLAEIAQARGKSVDGLKAAIESDIRASLARQVAAQHLTNAQAGKIQAVLDARITAAMNLKMGRVMRGFRVYGRLQAHRHWLVPPGAKPRHSGPTG